MNIYSGCASKYTFVMFRQFFLIVLPVIALSITSCRTAQKYIESGDYDGAIDYTVHKLQGKKKKKTEYVQGLEIAFQKANERDMRASDALTAENRPENWEKINRIHQDIRRRQDKVAPLLPLTASDGHQAQFLFVNIEKLEAESRRKAAEHLYNRAVEQLVMARQGDKRAAREAYYTLCDLENRYFRTFENKDQLKQQARELGTVHILFEIANHSSKVLPRDFNDRIMAISKRDLDSEWKVFHLQPESGLTPDYRAVLNLRHVDISPERISERRYTDEREIEDGWEYVYDARGNVKKDTAGNDIKHKRFVMVRADVVEVCQTKAARIDGQIDIFDASGRTRLDVQNIGAEVRFEHFASTFFGDQRALSDVSRSRIGGTPAPFPTDANLLAQVADRLKPEVRGELQRNRAIAF